MDEQFYYDNAGYSYDPRAETPEEGRRRSAGNLAASIALVEPEAEFRWVGDWDAHWGESDPPNTCEGCELWVDGECVGSLWCIDNADDDYRRVIEAELAAEYVSMTLGSEA